jgi:hypothetical protein
MLDFLAAFQRQGIEARRFSTTPLVAIHGWSDVPRGRPLFETIVVFESYPIPKYFGSGAADALRIEGRWSFTPNHYPFTLRAVPGENLRLFGLYNRRLYERREVEGVLEHLRTALGALAESPELRVGDLPRSELSQRRSEMSKKAFCGSSSFDKFKSVKPRSVDLSQVDLVERGYLGEAEEMPAVLTARGDDVDLAEWAADHRDDLDEDLRRFGAVLFRGFDVSSGPEFQRFAEVVCDELFEEYGDLPKGGEGARIYGATPYPQDRTILFHNEASHTHRWPRKQMFFCELPAAEGGESAIVDGRRVLRALDPALRERFASRGLLYVRNFTPSALPPSRCTPIPDRRSGSIRSSSTTSRASTATPASRCSPRSRRKTFPGTSTTATARPSPTTPWARSGDSSTGRR